MTDAAIANAHNRRGSLAAQINALQQQLEALRRELAVVDEFISRWHTFAQLDEGDSLIPSEQAVDKPVEKEKRIRPTNPSREAVGDVVEALLREWQRPASRARLFEELPNHGIDIQGTNPEMVFSTMLWRLQNRFERIPKRGYWLKGEPIPGDPTPLATDLDELLG